MRLSFCVLNHRYIYFFLTKCYDNFISRQLIRFTSSGHRVSWVRVPPVSSEIVAQRVEHLFGNLIFTPAAQASSAYFNYNL